MTTAANSQIKKLKANIGHFKAQLTRIAKYAQEQKDQVLVDLEGLKLRTEELQQNFHVYKGQSLDLFILTSDKDDFEEEFTEDEIEKRYFTIMSELRSIIKEAKSSGPRDDNNSKAIQRNKLPQLDIATFDGKDITQYSPFIDIFSAIVDKDEGLTPVQKLYYLKKYLKGDALLLINGLPLVNESYKQALHLLNKRYDNKNLLITHHINALLDFQPISKGTCSELRHLVSIARQHLGALKSLGQPTQYWDMIIIPILLRKLDTFSCRNYYSDRDSDKLPTLEELFSYIERRAMSFEETQVSAGKANLNKIYPIRSAILTNVCDTNKVMICKFCKSKDHKVFACKEFQSLSAQERINFAKKEKLCKLCLNAHTNKCQFHFKCFICKSKEHNSLLHSEENVCNIANSGSHSSLQNMVLLPTIKANFMANDGSYVTAKGLVDSGSQVSFINTNLVNQLNIPTFNCNVNVTALGQKQKSVTRAVNVSMYSTHDNYSCHTLFSVVDNITAYLPQTKFQLRDVKIPDSILLADDEFNVPSKISFLLSADVFFRIMLPDKITLSRDLFLLATKYGYIVSGNLKKDSICLFNQNILNDNVVMHVFLNEDRVNSILQKFWEEQYTTEISKEPILSHVCETEFQKSFQLIDNRFQVSLPLKVPIEEVNLGNSFKVALQRLNMLCKKFTKNPSLKDQYKSFINEYVALGHAIKIDLFKLEKPLECYYFLPHHAIFKEDSVTTKLRVVFDASAKTNLNLSLNDILHAGPVVQKELFDILILFRTYKFIAMTDIRHMFRQVRIDPSQTHLQCILWKENLDDPLLCLQLQTVTYGVTSSSFLATRCLVELGQRYGERYPLASSVLLNNSYIDDCLFGASSIQEVKHVRDELIELMRLGGFELHKWCASHPDILAGIPNNKRHYQNFDLNNTELTIKALGLLLNVNSDQFIISRPCGQPYNVRTKRTVLSFIGTFFDPLGLAGPIVTRAKEFLQKVWLKKLEWDTPLPNEVLLPWNSFFHDLMYMKPIYVKRDLNISGADNVQLIGYCDASSIAYGACIYIRAVQNDIVSVILLCSKSRIAPLKNKQTIPRLELNACLLLTNLYVKISNILHNCLFDKQILYSDSQVALCWLQNPPTKDNYVKNRVIAINEQAKDCIWSHVSGSSNPADCLSRGLMPSELGSAVLWWQGPPELQNVNYITKPFVHQNISCICTNQNNEQHVNCNVQDEVIPISKFSSILKLQRIVCYVLRFIKNCRLKRDERCKSKQLNVKEYELSMQVILKHVQSLHFFEEIDCIKRNKVIKSNLKKLYPFLDKLGVLRVGGRLENANIPFSQKHPIILPKNCNITNLIIQHEHCALLHAGLKLTFSSLSRRYYIISATTLIKSIINKCVPCFKFRAQKAQQLMAALPQDRVVQDRPFNKVGIDYCGPFNIKQSSKRSSVISKGYVCIFVCFVTKCVHLELVSDLTTDCFLSAFKRFYSRRGLPHTVHCDNASTFKGANNQLKELFKLCKSQAHQNAVTDYCNANGVDFKFIPSYSPTWGGLWEASVKSAKYHFKRIIGNLLFTYEQFNTIIVQVEAILNSRPITPFTGDISDFSFLTPGHFLINQPLTAIPEPDLAINNVSYLGFWKKCTKVKQDFWRVWHKSYLSQLLSRPKWYNVKPNIKEGVLVLLLGENVSPLQWPVARVIRVFTGSDGYVRSVEIKSKNGFVHKRAINKIAVLPIY